MELDHIFLFVEDVDRAILSAEDIGLVETYRRAHPGQGTANVCYAFENAFLELIWLTNREEAESVAIRRTRLAERADWRRAGTCPFGIAWRGQEGEQELVETWPYTPPYLPEGMSIPVATISEEPSLPMFFQSPGRLAPRDWPDERKGQLQSALGYTTIEDIELQVPRDLPIPDELKVLSGAGLFSLGRAESWEVKLVIGKEDSTRATLPLPFWELDG